MRSDVLITRRLALGAGVGVGLSALLGPAAFAAAPSGGRLAFSVLRNGDKVGEHAMSFSRSGGLITVSTDVEMRVRIGPVPVFRYTHTAQERWQGDSFQQLRTTTSSNGKIERVQADRSSGGVAIEGPSGRVTAPANAAPLTHWNRNALDQPLFNPQVGKLVRVRVSRAGADSVELASGRSLPAERWSIRGEAEIDNWYDSQGVWAGLRGKLEDGSTLIYRRL